MAVTYRRSRLARPVVFKVFVFFLCLQRFRPYSVGGSFGCLLAVGSSACGLPFAAASTDVSASNTLDQDEKGAEALAVATARVGRAALSEAEDVKSGLLVDSFTGDRTAEALSRHVGAATEVVSAVEFDGMNWPKREASTHDVKVSDPLRRKVDEEDLRRRPLLRRVQRLDAEIIASENRRNDRASAGEGSRNLRESGGESDGTETIKVRQDGRVESVMTGAAMKKHLNKLVEESVADTENQRCNIAFVKTHKTASTTAATIFFRYGKRHNLNVANFKGHQSSIEFPDAVQQVRESGETVDLMHYHFAWDGFYEGRWAEAKAAYKKILRGSVDINFVTVVREPMSHYMSYYYYFLEPDTGLSITEYFERAGRLDVLRSQDALPSQQRRAEGGNDVGWHGFELLHNPLCAEFGVRTAEDLEAFIRDYLPDFAMILLTEQFEESLAIFMRMFNWRPIDMTYCRMIETKAGVSRFDGKLLTDVPKLRDLPPEVVAEIRRQTQLDQVLYKAAVKIYLEKRAEYEDHLESDMQQIRAVQSAVHEYLDYDASSPAHEWYEGDVRCFADPSPVRPF